VPLRDQEEIAIPDEKGMQVVETTMQSSEGWAVGQTSLCIKAPMRLAAPESHRKKRNTGP
jgi:hypothetical protein